MIQRTWAIMQKEFIQVFRDKSTLAVHITLPLIQLFLFAYAMNMNIEDMALVVADQSMDAESKSYITALTNSTYFDVKGYVDSEADVIAAIDAGKAEAGLYIPPDFSAQIAKGDAHVLFLVDGSEFFTAQSAYNAARVIGEEHAIEVLADKTKQSGLLAGLSEDDLPLNTRTRVLYNPTMADLWFIIPSMVALILQIQAINLTAGAVVREREAGTMEQLLVTPIRVEELLIGKITPNIIIALINTFTIVALGVVWFGVPLKGNLWLFLLMCTAYVISGMGLGLLISTASQNYKQALQLGALVMLSGTMLGGILFPRYTMPQWAQIVGNLFPLTYFVPIVRGLMTKGVGLAAIWSSVRNLLLYIVAVLFCATKAFKQGLD